MRQRFQKISSCARLSLISFVDFRALGFANPPLRSLIWGGWDWGLQFPTPFEVPGLGEFVIESNICLRSLIKPALEFSMLLNPGLVQLLSGLLAPSGLPRHLWAHCEGLQRDFDGVGWGRGRDPRHGGGGLF